MKSGIRRVGAWGLPVPSALEFSLEPRRLWWPFERNRQQVFGLRSALSSLRRGGELAQRPQEVVVPRWVQALPEGHAPWFVGGFLFCETCGGTASTNVHASPLLSRPCRRSAPEATESLAREFPAVAGGSRPRLRRLLDGRLPHGHDAWPDEARAPDERAWPCRLNLVGGVWTPSVGADDADDA